MLVFPDPFAAFNATFACFSFNAPNTAFCHGYTSRRPSIISGKFSSLCASSNIFRCFHAGICDPIPNEGERLRFICLTGIKLWVVGRGGYQGTSTPTLGVVPPPWCHLVLPKAPSSAPLIDRSFPPLPVCSREARATYPRVRSNNHAEPCHPGPHVLTTEDNSSSPWNRACSSSAAKAGFLAR